MWASFWFSLNLIRTYVRCTRLLGCHTMLPCRPTKNESLRTYELRSGCLVDSHPEHGDARDLKNVCVVEARVSPQSQPQPQFTATITIITIPYEEQRLPHPTGTGDASHFFLSTGVWIRQGHDAPVRAPARPARLLLKKQMLLGSRCLHIFIDRFVFMHRHSV